MNFVIGSLSIHMWQENQPVDAYVFAAAFATILHGKKWSQ